MNMSHPYKKLFDQRPEITVKRLPGPTPAEKLRLKVDLYVKEADKKQQREITKRLAKEEKKGRKIKRKKRKLAAKLGKAIQRKIDQKIEAAACRCDYSCMTTIEVPFKEEHGLWEEAKKEWIAAKERLVEKGFRAAFCKNLAHLIHAKDPTKTGYLVISWAREEDITYYEKYLFKKEQEFSGK